MGGGGGAGVVMFSVTRKVSNNSYFIKPKYKATSCCALVSHWCLSPTSVPVKSWLLPTIGGST